MGKPLTQGYNFKNYGQPLYHSSGYALYRNTLPLSETILKLYFLSYRVESFTNNTVPQHILHNILEFSLSYDYVKSKIIKQTVFSVSEQSVNTLPESSCFFIFVF